MIRITEGSKTLFNDTRDAGGFIIAIDAESCKTHLIPIASVMDAGTTEEVENVLDSKGLGHCEWMVVEDVDIELHEEVQDE